MPFLASLDRYGWARYNGLMTRLPLYDLKAVQQLRRINKERGRMFDANLGQPEPTQQSEPGFLHIEEKQEEDTNKQVVPVSASQVALNNAVSTRAREGVGTIEHLAARRPMPELDSNTPEIKQRLNELRIKVTRLVAGVRWGGESVEATAQQLIPLLNVGPVQQWKAVLIPFLYEIDRSGNMIPVWQKIIECEEPQDLPPDANPAETAIGRARRFAILMLGNYKMGNLSEQENPIGFAALSTSSSKAKTNVTKLLGQLATDPNTSLYATQALVRHATADAMQALVSALRKAEGWAKVDVVEACLELGQEGFYDLLVVRGLEGVAGLESYVAIPIYCSIPLERYLRVDNSVPRVLSQQAALIFAQVLHDSMTPTRTNADKLPPAFKGSLATVGHALFAYARSFPDWQSAYAVHRLGVLLGHYWAEISRGAVQDSHIIEPIYKCLTMMPEVERWIDGPGRDVLLATVHETKEDEALLPVIKALGELGDSRTFLGLTARIEAIKELGTREHALYISTVCDMLVRLGDRRAVPTMLQLIERVIDINKRMALAKRRDNLPSGDADIPGSIVYAAVIRACGQLGQRSALEQVTRAMNDFDTYVRTQAIEALKRIDSSGEDVGSHIAVREALRDPRDVVVRLACSLIAQYRDVDAQPELQHIIETRPDLAPAAYEALRQIGQL